MEINEWIDKFSNKKTIGNVLDYPYAAKWGRLPNDPPLEELKKLVDIDSMTAGEKFAMDNDGRDQFNLLTSNVEWQRIKEEKRQRPYSWQI